MPELSVPLSDEHLADLIEIGTRDGLSLEAMVAAAIDMYSRARRYSQTPLPPGKRTRQTRFWSKVRKTDDCWFWTACRLANGYGKFQGSFAHRVAYEFAYGPVPEGLLVLHQCDNRSCVRPDHLVVGTPKENMDDMVAKGRQGFLRKPWRPYHRLTPNDSKTIFDLSAAGVPQTYIAQQLGVSVWAVWTTLHGQPKRKK